MGTKRLVKKFEDQGRTVRVLWDREWEEFQVVLVGAPAATYHTTDKDDALATAAIMLRGQA